MKQEQSFKLISCFSGYVPGDIENAAKTQIFFTILEESVSIGDRLLVFSQSLFTLNMLEEFLQQRPIPSNFLMILNDFVQVFTSTFFFRSRR